MVMIVQDLYGREEVMTAYMDSLISCIKCAAVSEDPEFRVIAIHVASALSLFFEMDTRNCHDNAEWAFSRG